MKAFTLVLIILIGVGQFANSQSLRSSQKISMETYKKSNINLKYESIDNEFIPSKTAVYPSKITDVDLLKKKLDSMTIINNYEILLIKYQYDAKGRIINQKVFERNLPNSIAQIRSEISYTYDSYNNIIEEITKSKISGQFENHYKYNYTYDINGNRTQYLCNQWISNQWQDVTKIDYTFNANQDILNYTSYSYSVNQNKWICNGGYECTYDNNNNLILYNRLNFDTAANQFIISYKTEYTNDTIGNVIETIESILNIMTQQLEFDYKIRQTYTVSGLPDSSIYYDWDVQNSVWDIHNCNNIDYNTNGSIATRELIYWDVDSNDWVALHKWANTYDSNDNLIKQIRYDKQTSYGPWRNYTKETYIYNFSNIRVQTINSNWNNNSGVWVDYLKNTTTYNTLYPFVSLCLPDPKYSFDEANFPFMPIQEVEYLKSDTASQFHETGKNNYYFSDISIVSIKTPFEKQLKIYPNPSTDFIFFEIENRASTYWVDIMDIQSKIIIKEELNSDGKISVSQLPKGIYIYRLYNQENVIVGKFIVE